MSAARTKAVTTGLRNDLLRNDWLVPVGNTALRGHRTVVTAVSCNWPLAHAVLEQS